MGRLYTVSFEDVAVTAVQDLFEVLAPSNRPVFVHGWHLAQTSDVGDAAEEILQIETVRGVGNTSGSGGSTPGENPVNVDDAAATTVVEANNTTRMVAGGGSLLNLEQYGWNIRIPWTHFYTPELRPKVAPADHWTLSLNDTPADSITVSGTLWIEEQ